MFIPRNRLGLTLRMLLPCYSMRISIMRVRERSVLTICGAEASLRNFCKQRILKHKGWSNTSKLANDEHEFALK